MPAPVKAVLFFADGSQMEYSLPTVPGSDSEKWKVSIESPCECGCGNKEFRYTVSEVTLSLVHDQDTQRTA